MPDKPQQDGPAILSFDGGELLIVEFDDQGLCYDRDQMLAVTGRLDAVRKHPTVNDAIMIVFVHGWKHNGSGDDDNLKNFCDVLRAVAQKEKMAGPAARPVLGVFAAWRGLSIYGPAIVNMTFWDRKQAGARVATGSVRELLGRLRAFRAARETNHPGRTVLVVVGHSFGGMVVYSAIAQSLIEAAATEEDQALPRFANLVLLVNPAFEAVRYLPIHTLLRERAKLDLPPQSRPVFVSVTAANDWATGFLFPLGMAISLLQESANTKKEKAALWHTMGHLPWLKTHELYVAPTNEADGLPQRSFGQSTLSRVQFGPENPFWTVRASKEIIDGHNGIFLHPFLEFLKELVFDHL